ncbi:MAG TPA: prepilin-type N-terminal cleavage/methylation domain-containing protein [Chthoniobacterales bacterium]
MRGAIQLSRRWLRPRGFSLIELLTVIAVIAIIAVLIVPAFNRIGQANRLSSAAFALMNTLSQARGEAIAQNTLVQLRVAATDVSGEQTAYRYYSLWRLDRDANGVESFQPLTRWEAIPQGVYLETDAAPMTKRAQKNSKYAARDYTGTHALNEPALNNRVTGVPFRSGAVEAVYVEFLPDGSLNFPSLTTAAVYFMLSEGAPGSQASSTNPNWRAVFVTALSGALAIREP